MKKEEFKEEWDKVEKQLGEAAQTLAKLFSSKPAPKDPTTSIEKPTHPSLKRLEKGVTTLLDFLISPDSMDPEIITEEFTEQLCQLAAVASILTDHPEQYVALLTTGKTLQEVFGLDDDSMEKLYRATKYLYEQQLYEEASAAFCVLTIISPDNHTFWLGMANSEYFLANFENAVAAYAMAASANPFDPLCHLYTANSYEKMNQKDLAINALELALVAIGEQDQYKPWKKSITEQKQRLEKLR